MTAVFLSVAAHAATHSVDLSVDDHPRVYSYVLPSDAKGPLPVVLVLPDTGRDVETVLQQDKWAGLAADKGFIAVALTPLPVDPSKPEMFQTNPGYWSDGSGRGNARRGDLDDVAYVSAVLDDLGKRESIDRKRLYATGLGNGGSMVNRLGLELSDRLAAIAPVSGHLWKTGGEPLRPLPVLLIYGSSDPVDPVNGGAGLNVWTHGFERRPAAIDSADAWAKAMSCAKGPVAGTLAKGLSDSAWTDCAGSGAVDYLVVPGQGHHWPGGADDHLLSLGASGDALDATPFLWEWFKSHPKP